MTFLRAHSKSLAALLSGAIGEAITDGLLTGEWVARGHFIAFILVAGAVYASPPNEAG